MTSIIADRVRFHYEQHGGKDKLLVYPEGVEGERTQEFIPPAGDEKFQRFCLDTAAFIVETNFLGHPHREALEDELVGLMTEAREQYGWGRNLVQV